MRIAELSAQSGTSIPTIKYYLREGLLPPGAATGRNQADYGEEHVRRLRLVRALIDVGGVPVATVREVLAAVDEPDLPSHKLLGVAHCLVPASTRRDPDDPAWRAARAEVDAIVAERGWWVHEEAPARDAAADAIAALRALGQDDLLANLPVWTDAAERVAAAEVTTVIARGGPADMVEAVVTGTVLGEAVLNALRRLAQEATSARLLGATPD
ncbi:MerR family transcriptional regulator [Luedemannella flava]|uniref:MerR family transcriptional regulator n=1 Tax=Luedemannella flava TaxID=349316 RepID=A0ABP4YFA8_9ACTN